MAIVDKTRKILWGRSGNRCAICKNILIVEATSCDDNSVVADECHIISSRPEGPRYDPTYPAQKIDSYENLILLCRTHHKLVDDQTATFTANILREMRSNHEVWVAERLADQEVMQPVRVRRVKANIPSFLSRLRTGKEILDVISNAMAGSFDHDELKSQQEVDLVANFFQTAQDWADISLDLEAGERVRMAHNLSESLRQLEDNGFFVFGAREIQVLDGGAKPGRSDWPVSILRVLRQDNDEIVPPRTQDAEKENPDGKAPRAN